MATHDPALRITYAGREATTIALAAAEHSLSQRHMSTTLTRLGVTPLPRAGEPNGRAEIDARTPLYDAAEVRAALERRPGRGANLRGHN